MNTFGEDSPLLGNWIAADGPASEPQWPAPEWLGAGDDSLGEAFYRHTFTVADPAALAEARLRVDGRQRTDVYINGRLLKRCIHWLGAYEVDLWHHLKPGRNVLCLHALDKERGLPVVAPALCLQEVVAPEPLMFKETAAWRCAVRSAPAEWMQVWFDDREWAQATVVEPVRERAPEVAPRPILLRKDFALPAAAQRATVRITGLGLYELRINGRKVGDAHLTPGWTEYDCRVEYQTLDVAALLQPGRNRVEIQLGNGWWLLHHRAFARDGVDRSLKARMDLKVACSDGFNTTIATGSDWQAFPSPVRMSHLYHGETVDCAFDADQQPPVPVRVLPEQARLVPQAAEPVRCVERRAPIALRRTAHGTWLADFGQNMAGWVELRAPATAAPRISVVHAELLRADGSLNTDSLRTARATCAYLNVGPQSGSQSGPLAPRFTYHGFRYAEVLGWPGMLTVDDLRACVVHADLQPVGEFSCSEPLFNQLFEATRWSFKSNFHAVPSDCPQRDERLGWMADAGNIPDVAALYFDISRYFHKWAVDMDDALGRNGYFPNFAPTMGGSERGTPGWADAGVKVPWTLYQIYGDKDQLAAHYPFMRRHFETMLAESSDGLFAVKGWGDWLAVEASPQEPIGSAYFFHCADILARAANALGHADDAARYAAQLPLIADAYQRAYYNPQTGDYANGTQTMNAMPLFFGITPPQLRDRVFARIVADIEAHERHLTTGFLGTTFLFEVLAIHGRHDLVHALLTQRDFPSHGRILDAGATTVTEAWNAFLGDDFASHNHFNLGAPTAWFFRHLVGIQLHPEQPGGRAFHLRPVFPDGIEHASAAWTGPAGRVAVAWHRDGDAVAIEITIPADATATLLLPGQTASTPLAPGASHRFRKGLNRFI